MSIETRTDRWIVSKAWITSVRTGWCSLALPVCSNATQSPTGWYAFVQRLGSGKEMRL
jgi:hypothetical protein